MWLGFITLPIRWIAYQNGICGFPLDHLQIISAHTWYQTVEDMKETETHSLFPVTLTSLSFFLLTLSSIREPERDCVHPQPSKMWNSSWTNQSMMVLKIRKLHVCFLCKTCKTFLALSEAEFLLDLSPQRSVSSCSGAFDLITWSSSWKCRCFTFLELLTNLLSILA